MHVGRYVYNQVNADVQYFAKELRENLEFKNSGASLRVWRNNKNRQEWFVETQGGREGLDFKILKMLGEYIERQKYGTRRNIKFRVLINDVGNGLFMIHLA